MVIVRVIFLKLKFNLVVFFLKFFSDLLLYSIRFRFWKGRFEIFVFSLDGIIGVVFIFLF